MKTNLRHTLQMLGLIVALLLGTSCERRPMYDNHGGQLYIEIELDVDVDVDVDSLGTRAMPPQIFAVAFHKPGTHELLQTEYVPQAGGYVSVTPGLYDIMVYNFDTEYVQVRNQHNLYALEAFTSEVTSDVASRFSRVTDIISRHRAPSNDVSRSYQDNPLIYEPDHLYAELVENFNIPTAISEDEVVHLHVHPTTICEKFFIRIGPITNGQYIQSAEVFLTGMGSAKLVAERKISGGPATIWFPISPNKEVSEFTTNFYSFGKYPGAENRVYLIVHLTDTSGNEYDGEWDVTDQLEKGGHDIVIDTGIEIPEPKPGGGFDPTVNPWDENVTDILI